MDIFIIQNSYQNKHLVVVNGDVYVYRYENVNLLNQFYLFKQKMLLLVKKKVCTITEFSGAEDEEEFNGNTLLLKCEDKEYVYISGLEIFNFKTDDKVIVYISLMGKNMIQ